MVPDHIIDAHVHFDCGSVEALEEARKEYGQFMDEVGLDAALVMAKSAPALPSQ